MAINRTSPKKGKVVDIPDATITIGTPTIGNAQVSVAFTVASTPATGGPVTKYTAISSPGSFTGESSTSPVTVTGLTNGTAYTFQVAAANATGRGPLSSASDSATPAFVTSFESIATVTVGSGGQSSITFSSIPSTFKHLQIRYIARSNEVGAGGSGIKMQLNSDTASNYSYHILRGDGSGVGAYSGASQTSALITYDSASNGEMANMFGAGIIDILEYQNTNKTKTIKSFTGRENNGSGGVAVDAGLWISTSTVTGISLQPNSGTLFQQYSQFALYGIKG